MVGGVMCVSATIVDVSQKCKYVEMCLVDNRFSFMSFIVGLVMC